MITFKKITSSFKITPSQAALPAAPVLSLVILSQSPSGDEALKGFVERFSAQAEIELVVVLEPETCVGSSTQSTAAWCFQKGCCVIETLAEYHLPGLCLDAGILACRGQRIWMVETHNPLPAWQPEALLACLKDISPANVVVFTNPKESQQFANMPGAMLPWIDWLYKGMALPLENLIFPRQTFNEFGLLDPHIIMAGFYFQELMLRICRHTHFEKVENESAAIGIQSKAFPGYFYHWVDFDHGEKLQPAAIDIYEIDKVGQFAASFSENDRWNLYLSHMLPYYYAHRQSLPEGLPEIVQSVPPVLRQLLLAKGDYETTVDVSFRNYDQFSQGENCPKLNYIHTGQLNIEQRIAEDGLLIFRTADHSNFALGQRTLEEGLPVAYALDDDLLHFYQYGGSFAAFKPGHPTYDCMVDTIKLADVVLCGGPYVEKTILPLNPRTVQFQGSVLPQFLPGSLEKPDKSFFKFGYAGGGYRAEEMNMIWPAIKRICQEYGEHVRFEFWGIDPSKLPDNLPQVSFVPFSVNYYEYLNRLKAAGFDAMLVPLLNDPLPRRGKSPNKLYESAVAGAVGLYSNVPTYSTCKDNNLGLMIDENDEAWYSGMKTILDMPAESYSQLLGRTQMFVREFWTTPAMLPVHQAGMESIFFHGATRSSRGEDGRPVVMFAFPVIAGMGGGEIVFRRRMELALKAGIRPLAVIPEYLKDSPDLAKFVKYLDGLGVSYDFALYRVFVLTPSKDDIMPYIEEETNVKALFSRHKVALVHSAGYVPVFGKVCSELKIPHVVGNYGLDDDFQWPTGRLPFKYCELVHSDTIRYATQWAKLFESDWRCIRDVAPEEFFRIGFDRIFGARQAQAFEQPVRLAIVGHVYPRKSTLEAIQAVGLLKKKGYQVQLLLYGIANAIPEYFKRCQDEIERLGLGEDVVFKGFATDLIHLYINIDILLSVSTFESFPTAIKEATAIGTLVVNSQPGGIAELMKDGVNCIYTRGTAPEQIAEAVARAIDLSPEDILTLRRNAFRMARQEFHPQKGLADLLAMYNLVLQMNSRERSQQPINAPCIEAAPRIEALPRIEAASRPTRSDTPGLIVERTPNFPESTRRVGSKISYEFSPRHPGWSGIHIFVGTHLRQASGKLELVVRTRYGEVLRKVSIRLEDVHDNDWAKFWFEPIEHGSGQVFNLEFSLKNLGSGTQISFYEGSGPRSGYVRILRRVFAILKLPVRGSNLHCKEYYTVKE
jgi:glycosyltransferase involved in cell wall biosynthesis